MTTEQELAVLNDFFAWSGGRLPQSIEEIEMFVDNYVIVLGPRDELVAYLLSEVLD